MFLIVVFLRVILVVVVVVTMMIDQINEVEEEEEDLDDEYYKSTANVEKVMRQTKSEWRAYNAVSRYEIDPNLMDWFYPKNEQNTKKRDVLFEGDDDNLHYDFEDKDDENIEYVDGVPQHRIDDRTIRLSNNNVVKRLVPHIIPPDSYFEKGELAVIESWNNPMRSPCRHVFGLFTSLTNLKKKHIFRANLVKKISEKTSYFNRTL